jgi:hypothetical protein
MAAEIKTTINRRSPEATTFMESLSFTGMIGSLSHDM